MFFIVDISHHFTCGESKVIVGTSPPPLSAGGLSLQPNFQKGGGLTGPQLLEGDAGKKGGSGVGGCNFHIKINLKSEIFNDKKSLGGGGGLCKKGGGGVFGGGWIP